MPGTPTRLLSEEDRDPLRRRSISSEPSRHSSIESHASSYHPYHDSEPPDAHSHSLSPNAHAPQKTSLETDGRLSKENERLNNFTAKLESRTPSPKAREPFSWWWWWEIIAICLSIICMCGLVGVLIKIDNMSLQSWILPIQPNSLIAALITIAKASMMLVVASGIGQLKWRHFITGPRRLADLQVYDGASRGPWGSAMLIWNLCFLRIRALVTLGFALITIVALGMDTSAQQILKFPLREAALRNVSVELGIADAYSSKGHQQFYLLAPWEEKSNLLTLQTAVINGISGTAYNSYFTCHQPASRCQWNTYTTLGICGTAENVTDSAVRSCGPIERSFNTMDCNYSIPILEVLTNTDETILSWEAVAEREPVKEGYPATGTMLFQSHHWRAADLNSSLLGYFMMLNATTDGFPTYNSTTRAFDPPAVDVYLNTLYWCARTYRNVRSSQTEMKEELVSTEPLTYNGGFSTNTGLGVDELILQFVANSTGKTYLINYSDSYFMSYSIGDLVSYKVWSHANIDLIALGVFLRHSDMNTVFTNIADTLTNQFRAITGDNYNASTMKGEAFFEETYIHVRWGWIALPLAEVLLTAILLVVSILVTQKEPLLKESVMALLMSELEGWSEDELDLPGPQTKEKLDELADKMIARFEADDLGHMRFRKM